eukprot:13724181-Alexandrium_andersonii.AAC.1
MMCAADMVLGNPRCLTPPTHMSQSWSLGEHDKQMSEGASEAYRPRLLVAAMVHGCRRRTSPGVQWSG